MYRIYAIILILLLAENPVLIAQENDVQHYELDPVVVTGSRIPYYLSESVRSV